MNYASYSGCPFGYAFRGYCLFDTGLFAYRTQLSTFRFQDLIAILLEYQCNAEYKSGSVFEYQSNAEYKSGQFEAKVLNPCHAE